MLRPIMCPRCTYILLMRTADHVGYCAIDPDVLVRSWYTEFGQTPPEGPRVACPSCAYPVVIYPDPHAATCELHPALDVAFFVPRKIAGTVQHAKSGPRRAPDLTGCAAIVRPCEDCRAVFEARPCGKNGGGRKRCRECAIAHRAACNREYSERAKERQRRRKAA